MSNVTVRLADCPPGLFATIDGHWGFKTEYAHKSEADGRYYPEAYVVDSGEFFWGGVTDHPARANLLVVPLDAEDIRHRTAALAAKEAELAAERAKVEKLREALEVIAAKNQEREWTALSTGGSDWVCRDGQYARIARATLAETQP